MSLELFIFLIEVKLHFHKVSGGDVRVGSKLNGVKLYGSLKGNRTLHSSKDSPLWAKFSHIIKTSPHVSELRGLVYINRECML